MPERTMTQENPRIMCATPAEDIISEHFKNKIVIIRRECGDNYSHFDYPEPL